MIEWVGTPSTEASFRAADRRMLLFLRHVLPDVQGAPGTRLPAGIARLPCRADPLPSELVLKQGEINYVAPSPDFQSKALISSRQQYEAMWQRSIEDKDGFWGELASEFFWQKPWDRCRSITTFNFDVRKGPIHIEWFPGGTTNVCFNAVDRHVIAGRAHEEAILWEGNDPGQERRITWGQLLDQVCQMANYLRSRGVGKGDAVCLYMPMVAELPMAMLACARIGAIHSVVFGGFSAESLAGRMADCRPKILLTCNATRRGGKLLALKPIVDAALGLLSAREAFQIESVLVYENSFAMAREQTPFTPGRDVWWQDAVSNLPTHADVEWMGAEDPLFMLYTSGSTGKPKGVVHTTGGYMVYAGVSFKYVFDYRRGDVFWCTADCGWITGHTYLTYGPLLCGATIVIFEGVPTWPDAGRCWEIVDKFQVSIFYTAPTAIRTLEAQGDEFVARHSRSSLRLLGSVGEPINARAWHWYHRVVGDGRCPIVDTWWQTETGGVCISPLPGAWPLKPGCATLPFFGVEPVILAPDGTELEGEAEGYLCLRRPWPGMARTLFQNHERFEEAYFKVWPGYYATGDGCRRDHDGYIWLTGRVDDVINVSGHRISTGEVEGALQSHPACAESAVVAFEHDVKGQGIYAYVVLSRSHVASEEVRKALRDCVRSEIGGFAAPDVIHWAPGLPKTRSGKIMRRILRKIATNELDQLGDTSSLADPSVVEEIISSRGQ